MPLERRLVPINAFIGLCDRAPPWPSTLADAGFRLAALEVPVLTEAGTVTLDGVAHSRTTDELLVVECKSGANIEEDQATRLATVEATSVVRSAAISLGTPAEPQIEVVYLCLEEDAERIMMGLDKVGWQGPVLELSTRQLRLAQGSFTLPSLRNRFDEPIPLPGLPPGFVTVDPESPDDAFDRLVRPVLVECQAQRCPAITISSLTERAIPHLPMFGRRAKGTLQRKMSQAARRICAQASDNYLYQPDSQNREATVYILRTPEDADPRGRTQAYQALARRGGAPRRPRAEAPGQAPLFESLLNEPESDNEEAEEGDDERGQGDAGTTL
jgi:hypothetical protein